MSDSDNDSMEKIYQRMEHISIPTEELPYDHVLEHQLAATEVKLANTFMRMTDIQDVNVQMQVLKRIMKKKSTISLETTPALYQKYRKRHPEDVFEHLVRITATRPASIPPPTAEATPARSRSRSRQYSPEPRRSRSRSREPPKEIRAEARRSREHPEEKHDEEEPTKKKKSRERVVANASGGGGVSMSLAKIGLQHSLICAAATAKEIKNFHVTEFGRCYVIETAPVIVASVLTWVNRDLTHLAPLIKCWMLDEAHHLTLGTSWHKCIEPLVNAKGLGVTATPLRADKKSLGRKTIVKMNKGLSYEDFRDVGWSDELLVEHGHGKLIETGDGLFDELVVTLTMGELIELGFLCSYRIYTVPSQLDLSDVNVTSGGDYNQKKLAAASDTADITGDAVEHYKRLAYGKQAITFCVSIEHAKHVTQQFNDAGINSFMLSSKTKLRIRQKKEKEFRKGIITNLINVDLFSEGYDVPACGVVIMLRKTMSYGLMMQQFGRMLRPSADKEYGILLDHVGNVAEHFIYGAPHDSPEWTLDPPKKKKKKITDEKDTVTRTCPSCFGFYLPKSNVPTAFVCPYCGHAESDEEINNAAKEMQIREGTLVEYDNSYLTGILNEIKKTDRPVEQLKKELYAAPDIVKHSAVKNHLAKQEAQRQLRTWIGSWCENIALQRGLDIETTQGEFARVYGLDVFKAQTLPERAATDLLDKIKSNWSDHITGNSVVS